MDVLSVSTCNMSIETGNECLSSLSDDLFANNSGSNRSELDCINGKVDECDMEVSMSSFKEPDCENEKHCGVNSDIGNDSNVGFRPISPDSFIEEFDSDSPPQFTHSSTPFVKSNYTNRKFKLDESIITNDKTEQITTVSDSDNSDSSIIEVSEDETVQPVNIMNSTKKHVIKSWLSNVLPDGTPRSQTSNNRVDSTRVILHEEIKNNRVSNFEIETKHNNLLDEKCLDDYNRLDLVKEIPSPDSPKPVKNIMPSINSNNINTNKACDITSEINKKGGYNLRRKKSAEKENKESIVDFNEMIKKIVTPALKDPNLCIKRMALHNSMREQNTPSSAFKTPYQHKKKVKLLNNSNDKNVHKLIDSIMSLDMSTNEDNVRYFDDKEEKPCDKTQNTDLFTPRRKLFFRNALNNSLDDSVKEDCSLVTSESKSYIKPQRFRLSSILNESVPKESSCLKEENNVGVSETKSDCSDSTNETSCEDNTSLETKDNLNIGTTGSAHCSAVEIKDHSIQYNIENKEANLSDPNFTNQVTDKEIENSCEDENTCGYSSSPENISSENNCNISLDNSDEHRILEDCSFRNIRRARKRPSFLNLNESLYEEKRESTTGIPINTSNLISDVNIHKAEVFASIDSLLDNLESPVVEKIPETKKFSINTEIEVKSRSATDYSSIHLNDIFDEGMAEKTNSFNATVEESEMKFVNFVSRSSGKHIDNSFHDSASKSVSDYTQRTFKDSKSRISSILDNNATQNSFSNVSSGQSDKSLEKKPDEHKEMENSQSGGYNYFDNTVENTSPVKSNNEYAEEAIPSNSCNMDAGEEWDDKDRSSGEDSVIVLSDSDDSFSNIMKSKTPKKPNILNSSCDRHPENKSIEIDDSWGKSSTVHRKKSKDSKYNPDLLILRHNDSSPNSSDVEYTGVCYTVKDSSSSSSEVEDNDKNPPWADLASYLKKNIPAYNDKFALDHSFAYGKKRVVADIPLPGYSSCPDHTSFLLSLTEGVPLEMCHPEALKYRESFNVNKNNLTDLLFKLYNQEIFDSKLPFIEIRWSGRLTTTAGITKSMCRITKEGKIRKSGIKLSKTIVNNASKLRDVLLHELCHAANWLIDEKRGGHGPLFMKWAAKAWARFPEIPKVRSCHQYELKWKYLYKCPYCGYQMGRMKLSLDQQTCNLCLTPMTVCM